MPEQLVADATSERAAFHTSQRHFLREPLVAANERFIDATPFSKAHVFGRPGGVLGMYLVPDVDAVDVRQTKAGGEGPDRKQLILGLIPGRSLKGQPFEHTMPED